ncbi:MAG: PAS domain S-box protein [Elusimicrobiota bacterium]
MQSLNAKELNRLIGRRHPRRAKALEELGAGFAALYEYAPLAIATLSPQGRFLQSNRALQTYLGYDEEELSARSFNDVTYPEDRPACAELFEKLQRREIDHFEMEKRYVRKDGEVVWAHIVVAAVRAHGAVHHTIGVAVDITARRRAEDSLRASEERYRSLYGRTPAMLLSIDADGRIVSASDRWLEAFGAGREAVVGRPWLEFLAPQSRSFAQESIFPQLARAGACTDVPFQAVRPDGQVMDMLLSAVAEKKDDGTVDRFLAVCVDATQRRRAEEKVLRLTLDLEERVRRRTAELVFQTALLSAEQESSPDGILIMDIQNRIIGHNRRFAVEWGLPARAERIGELDDFIEWALPLLAAPQEYVDRVKHLGEHHDDRSRYELVLLDGRTLETYSGPILGPENAHYGRVWYFRDITGRKRAESALREKSAELSRSNVELAMYAHAVSHDLVAPLNKISVYSEMLMERAASRLGEDERRYLERVQKTAVGMAQMLRDILAVSKVGFEPEPVETVDWMRVMDGVLSDLELLIAQVGAEVTAGELPLIRAQESLLRQLLSNLVGNAVKFRHKDRISRVEVGGRTTSEGIEIFVRDNGIGFAPEHGEEIFLPFVRLNRAGDYEGYGIGLATCQRIATRLGGRLTAAGVPGTGATFTLRLPAAMLVEPPGGAP